MTKRSQSSGLPRTAARKTPESGAKPNAAGKGSKALREYRSRAEREARIQRWVIIGIAVVAALVAIIVVGALVYDQLYLPGQPVASVNGETITVAQLRQRVRLERALINERINDIIAEAQGFGDAADQYLQYRLQQEPFASWWNEIQISDQLGSRVLNDMVNELLVQQKAAELGISVSQEDVQEQIRQFFEFIPPAGAQDSTETTETPQPTVTPTPLVSPTPSPEPTAAPVAEATAESTAEATVEATAFPTTTPVPTSNPTEVAQQFQTRVDETLARARSAAGASQEQMDRFFEMKALRQKVAESVTADTVSTTDVEVNARHILVDTEEKAQDVLAALNAGESFADLARAVSTDTGSGANGGELGWTPVSSFVQEFADAARDAEIGAFVGPIQSQFGYHILQVRDRRETDMSDFAREQAINEAFDTYLREQRDAEGANIETFPIWADNVPDDPVFVPRT